MVIAILGILAMIAIPRLSGFIASSKTGADTATEKTIKTSAMTAFSNGELVLGTGTNTISIDSDSAVTAAVVTATTGNTILGSMQKYLGTKLPVPQTGKKFLITFDANGGADVTVTN